MAANLEGALVQEDVSGAQGLEPVCALCEATCGLFALPHNSHAAELQQVAQLDDELAHCAVGCIQDDTISWLQASKPSLKHASTCQAFFINMDVSIMHG